MRACGCGALQLTSIVRASAVGVQRSAVAGEAGQLVVARVRAGLGTQQPGSLVGDGVPVAPEGAGRRVGEHEPGEVRRLGC